MVRLLPVLGLVVAAGCEIFGKPSCSEFAIAGIVLTVMDSTTSLGVVDSIKVVVRDGDYVETRIIPSGTGPRDVEIPLADERPGLYAVEVSSPRYRTWVMGQVRVRQDADGCHPVPQRVVARLQLR